MLLDGSELVNDVFGSGEPAEPQAGSQDFRERADLRQCTENIKKLSLEEKNSLSRNNWIASTPFYFIVTEFCKYFQIK